MQRYGLIGQDIGESLSPSIQTAAFQDCGIDASYELFDIEEIELPALVKLVRHMDGVNVTAPYKERALSLVDELDPMAEKVGAINTVHNSGKLVGYNTDCIGILSPLQKRMPIAGKSFVVLGAGGAARAAVFALTEAGGRVCVCNRTQPRAKRLAEEFSCELGDPENLPPGDVLIQATSLSSPSIPDEQLKTFGTVFDLVYKPLMTPLLQSAESLDCQVIQGIEMLVYQAAKAFEIWTGKKPDIALMMENAVSNTGGPR